MLDRLSRRDFCRRACSLLAALGGVLGWSKARAESAPLEDELAALESLRSGGHLETTASPFAEMCAIPSVPWDVRTTAVPLKDLMTVRDVIRPRG